jgi:hypothetical protein
LLQDNLTTQEGSFGPHLRRACGCWVVEERALPPVLAYVVVLG